MLTATKLPARAERETAKEKPKTLQRVERASTKPAAGFRIVFDSSSEQVDTDTGGDHPARGGDAGGDVGADVHQILRRRKNSSEWGDSRAKLLPWSRTAATWATPRSSGPRTP